MTMTLSAAATTQRRDGRNSSSKSPKNRVPEYFIEEEEEEDNDESNDELSVSTSTRDVFIPREEPLEDTLGGVPDLTLELADFEEENETTRTPEDPKRSYRTAAAATMEQGDEPSSTSAIQPNKCQYAALESGALVQIKVGAISLARKAWKKRRRSGSPLLVPCSVLNVERTSTLRWNVIYLLEKFGNTEHNSNNAMNYNSSKKWTGLSISLPELCKRHRTHLKSSLHQHAHALGFESTWELVHNLFNKQIQDTYGVKLIQVEKYDSDDALDDENDDNDEKEGHRPSSVLWLNAPLSRFRGQRRAMTAAILQLYPPPQDPHQDTLEHTGYVRTRIVDSTSPGSNGDQPFAESTNDNDKAENSDTTTTTMTTTMTNQKNTMYELKPLSAALRVNQKDVDSGLIQDGSFHAASVFAYDATGDAGLPLLTLSLNPSQSPVRDRLKRMVGVVPNRRRGGSGNLLFSEPHELLEDPDYLLQDLNMGMGPMQGKVVRLIKDGALIDCNVGRSHADSGAAAVKVYGFLRFQDTVQTKDSEALMDKIRQAEKTMDLAEREEKEDEDEEEDWDDIFSFQDEVEDVETTDMDDNDDEVEEEEEDPRVNKRSGELKIVHFSEPSLDFDVLQKLDEEDKDDDEVTEDITDLFSIVDGKMTYTDPETGEVQVLSTDIDDEEDDEDSTEADSDNIEIVAADQRSPTAPGFDVTRKATHRTKFLQVGDTLDVYVKSVSKQSSQLLLTMDASIQGMNTKDIKKAGAVNKKLERLVKQIGGLHRIDELKGQECDGIVKATSQTGDWLYVQPSMSNLPVGVATVPIEMQETLAKGDGVRIRLDGVDEERGQLAMQVINKKE